MTNAVNIAQSGSNNVTFRNKIINGACVIDQRNNGSAVTANGAYPIDRFYIEYSMDGAYSAVRDTTAPTGFINSLKFTTTTADASLSASQYIVCAQPIEGLNCTDLNWGAAAASAGQTAQPVTLSFWTRSSLTGTFGGSLKNSGSSRSYPFSYTISSANTWEQKSITIAGDTSGTWLTTNGLGINLLFSLGAGSNFVGTAGAWAGANYLTSTGATSVIGTLNATWAVTGVQLEAGTTASPFEYRQYGTELALCQRYCWVTSNSSGDGTAFGNGYVYSSGGARIQVSYPVTMRSKPTLTASAYTTWQLASTASSTLTSGGVTLNGSTLNMANLDCPSSGLTGGYAIILRDYSTASANLQFSAEL
jgi:hypothetical protein